MVLVFLWRKVVVFHLGNRKNLNSTVIIRIIMRIWKKAVKIMGIKMLLILVDYLRKISLKVMRMERYNLCRCLRICSKDKVDSKSFRCRIMLYLLLLEFLSNTSLTKIIRFQGRTISLTPIQLKTTQDQ